MRRHSAAVEVFGERLRSIIMFHDGLRSVGMLHHGPGPFVEDILTAAGERPGKTWPVAYQYGQQHSGSARHHQDDADDMQIKATDLSAGHGELEDRP